jgi:hypothetical protein
MSVVITKRGSLPKDEKFRGTCSHCHTDFLCNRSDGTYADYQKDGAFLRLTCPLPGCENAVIAYPLK